MQAIKIDEEFRTLIPPLTDDEFQRLEKSILAEGVREPIITWNGTIIDGHNRYRICEKHGLDFKTSEREFDSRDAAKIWIYENQLGRRNLEPGQRAALVIEQDEVEIRERARLRIGRPKKTGSAEPSFLKTEQQEQEKGRTNEILAKRAGVSTATVKRVLGVKRKDPELYNKIRSGEVTAREAYRQVTDEKKSKRKKAVFTNDGKRICTVCDKPINEGDYYECHKTMHKKCFAEYRATKQYDNPEISLIKNVPVFDINSLLIELEASADMLRSSWNQSIEISESMGVRLPDDFKERFGLAVQGLFDAIEETRKDK